MRKRSWTVVIILVGIALGAVREFLFVNLNYQLDHVQRSTEFSYAHSWFQAQVQDWGAASLVQLKWVLSVVFIAAMLGLCSLLSSVLFNDRRVAKVIALFYCIAAILALVFHWSSGMFSSLATISVKLLHLLQYPAILLVLLIMTRIKRQQDHIR